MNDMVSYIRNKVFSYPYLDTFTCYNSFRRMDIILFRLHTLLIEHSELLKDMYLSLICEVSTLSRNSPLYHYHTVSGKGKQTELRREDMLFIKEGMNFVHSILSGDPYDIRNLKINRGVLFGMFSDFYAVFQEYSEASSKLASKLPNASPSNMQEISDAQLTMHEINEGLGLDDSLLFGLYMQFGYYLDMYRQLFNRVYKSYLRIVYKEAKSAVKTRYDALPNAFQNGSRGLIRAVEYFDLSKSFSFKTYACKWVRKTILEESEKEVNMIPISNAVWRKYRKFEKVRNKYHKSTGNDFEYVAGVMGIDVAQVEEVYRDIDSKKVDYLDAPLPSMEGSSRENTLLDRIPQQTFETEQKESLIDIKLLGKGKHKKIMSLLFGFVGQDETESKIEDKQLRDEIVRQILNNS